MLDKPRGKHSWLLWREEKDDVMEEVAFDLSLEAWL